MPDASAEWLEADGLGGFASGTASGTRTRRYHAVLLAARRPPADRVVLVNGFDAWIETQHGRLALSAQRYAPDTLHPDGNRRAWSFETEPWPRWTFAFDDGVRLHHELFVPKGSAAVVLSWRVEGTSAASLIVRPFLSGRDYHALQHENAALCFDAMPHAGGVAWRTYPSLPRVVALTNGRYEHAPHWYRGFLYTEERDRGLDSCEDLASPGVLRWDLAAGEALLVLAAEGLGQPLAPETPEATVATLRNAERVRREGTGSRLARAADAYLVQRGAGKTIVAGYPWFLDWGRDTFIALRGLCLATGRLDDALGILLEWSGAVSEGMLPNRFSDHAGEAPEYNSVDASLWYVIAVHETLRAFKAAGRPVEGDERRRLEAAVAAILTGYAAGTRHRIHCDSDGLLAAGEPGVQLTWMDAKVGDWVVTPRIGKPVEIQALWLNALKIGAGLGGRWAQAFARGLDAFGTRFWNESAGCLYDIVDLDHEAGSAEALFRPNQILAVGGLPFALIDGERARQIVDAVEQQLWTPMGLRTLARGEPGYVGRYEGGIRERDGAYHQGTAWPWLLGPFVEAWVRVRGGTAVAKASARERFLTPLLRHLDEAGLGHVSEIADGDAPHTPRGCPFQAWSLGELLRLDRSVLA
jgi:predicted glycogen debranching enzyme